MVYNSNVHQNKNTQNAVFSPLSVFWLLFYITHSIANDIASVQLQIINQYVLQTAGGTIQNTGWQSADIFIQQDIGRLSPCIFIIDREFEFYEYFSFLKFNEFFLGWKNLQKIRNFANHRCLTCFDVLECNVHL